jgi:hypothetical protein
MGAIWIAYFTKSERVHATFVRRLGAAPAGAPVEPVNTEPDPAAWVEQQASGDSRQSTAAGGR